MEPYPTRRGNLADSQIILAQRQFPNDCKTSLWFFHAMSPAIEVEGLPKGKATARLREWGKECDGRSRPRPRPDMRSKNREECWPVKEGPCESAWNMSKEKSSIDIAFREFSGSTVAVRITTEQLPTVFPKSPRNRLALNNCIYNCYQWTFAFQFSQIWRLEKFADEWRQLFFCFRWFFVIVSRKPCPHLRASGAASLRSCYTIYHDLRWRCARISDIGLHRSLHGACCCT